MSDKENNTENNTGTEAVDTAPYLKKDNKTESSKTNIAIPVILILVSAIVIVATFYEDEYSRLLVTTGLSTESSHIKSSDNTSVTANDSVVITHEETISENTAIATVDTAEAVIDATPHAKDNTESAPVKQLTVAIEPAVTQQTQSESNTDTQATMTDTEVQPETVAVVEKPETKAAPVITDSTDNQQPVDIQVVEATDSQVPVQVTNADVSDSYSNNRASFEQARQQAIERAQQQAIKHNEYMQQRRKAHEEKVQARRQQYDERMKEYQKKRAELTAVQEALYLRAEQHRKETIQKMKEMHQRISELHSEMQKFMRESHKDMQNPANAQD